MGSLLLGLNSNVDAQRTISSKDINNDKQKFEQILGLQIMKQTYKNLGKSENHAKSYYQKAMKILGNGKMDFLEFMRYYQAGVEPYNFIKKIDTKKPNAVIYISQYDTFLRSNSDKNYIGNAFNTPEYLNFVRSLNKYYDLEIEIVRDKNNIETSLEKKEDNSIDLIVFSGHGINDKVRFGFDKDSKNSYMNVDDVDNISDDISKKLKENGVIFGYSCFFGNELAKKLDEKTNNKYIVLGSKTAFSNKEIKLKYMYPLVLTIKGEENMYRGKDYMKKICTYKK